MSDRRRLMRFSVEPLHLLHLLRWTVFLWNAGEEYFAGHLCNGPFLLEVGEPLSASRYREHLRLLSPSAERLQLGPYFYPVPQIDVHFYQLFTRRFEYLAHLSLWNVTIPLQQLLSLLRFYASRLSSLHLQLSQNPALTDHSDLWPVINSMSSLRKLALGTMHMFGHTVNLSVVLDGILFRLEELQSPKFGS